jgi:PKD repeat protein
MTLLLALCAGTGSASAIGYGELTHFGSKGTGHGQFIEHGADAVAFGADPTDNSLYVVDEPEEHVFRIQKLSASGEYQAAVSVKVKGAGPEPESGIEGVAVEPFEGRIYVLAVQSRGNEEQVGIDPETLAAGALYAFSTTPKEGKLEPASGTKEGGLLAGAAVFHPQSKELGQALLEPSGIAVDPTTHDIVVMGKEDRGEGVEPSRRVALERISSKGVLGSRWVDSSPEAFFASEEASSPVVTQAGKVYVLGEVEGAEHPEQIDEIPSDFSSPSAPKTFVAFDSGPGELVTFPGEPRPSEGGGMTIAPDGTLYVSAKVHQESNGKTVPDPGVLAFTSTGAELGWTGGQSTQLGLGHCTISFLGHPSVAALSGQRMFVFDSNPEAPSVLAFGPGGSGCPVAKSSAIAASVRGAPAERSVNPGDEVDFSSTVTEANALSVKWSFGDGSAEVETGNKHQTPEVLHTFAAAGEFKVREIIHTDNLNNPELVQEKTVLVKASGPVANFTTEEVTLGRASTFNANTSKGFEGSAVTQYKWTFGDGSTAVTSEPEITHTYGKANTYTVTLQVEDALKHVSPVTEHSAVVRATEETQSVVKGADSTQGTGTGSSAPPPPTGGGVLAFRAGLSSSALSVSKTGVVPIKINCGGPSICRGTITLRTAGAVGPAKHKSVLTLGAGSFSLAGGQSKAVSLRLSSKGKALLARSHTLKAIAIILARDSAGATHTMRLTVTLHAAKTKHH